MTTPMQHPTWQPSPATTGLPAATFTKIYANTSQGTQNGMTPVAAAFPRVITGWGLEEDLDIEWAHAMAPTRRSS